MSELFITSDTGPLVPQNVTFNNVDIEGTLTLATPATQPGSCRANIDPSSRPGSIGYRILASDPNPSYLPWYLNPPMTTFDYIDGGTFFQFTDANTITFLRAGNYSISFNALIVGASTGGVIFEVLSSDYPFIVGGVPAISTNYNSLLPITVIPLPVGFTHATTLSCTANFHASAGVFIHLGYVTEVDADVSITSNISISSLSNGLLS